jgi:hypothetical protein
MLLAIGERHDDVHHRRRQRQEPFDLFSVTHVTTMTTLDLLCQLSIEQALSRLDPYTCPPCVRGPEHCAISADRRGR